MKKKGLILIGILIVVIVVILDSISPAKINWNKSYNENKTQPFDLKVIHQQLDTVFYDYEIETLKETFYEYQNQPYIESLYDEKEKIYINIDERFVLDPASEEEFLNFIYSGNTAFISANNFSPSLLDSLDVLEYVKKSPCTPKDSLNITLNQQQASLTYQPKLKYSQTYFKDSIGINRLGLVQFSAEEDFEDLSKKETNFIKISHGSGSIYLHTQPEIFTNYELLKATNTDYINRILSLLPIKESSASTFSRDTDNKLVFNDTFLSKKYILFQSNFLSNQELINSPLRFIKSNKELYMAWILVLIAIGLFLIINSKRKQRIVPIIPKVKNTSLEFVETIATLYEDADNFQPIIEQKIHIFFKYIRGRYNIVTDSTNAKLASQLSKKSGYEFDKAKELIRFINTIKNRDTSSMSLLTKLNTEIENFYKNTTAWKN